MTDLYEAAKKYTERGWHVFPIKVDSTKRPAVAWNKYRKRQATDEELQDWFKVQKFNIGIATGRGSSLFVVDVDDAALINKWLQEYPTDCVSETSKGVHLFYDVSDGEVPGNTVRKLEEGIDTRGEGGYVVAPPSTVDGHTYTWSRSENPRPLPFPLLNKIKAATFKFDKNGSSEDGVDIATRILRQGFTPGRHNEELKDTGRYLYRSGMSEPAIYAVMKRLNAWDDTPLPDNEMYGTLKSGIDYEKSRVEHTGNTGSEDEFPVVKMLDAVHLWKESISDWLVPEWLPEGALIALVAPPENYKTWIALDAAVTVAHGPRSRPFLGLASCDDAAPVLVVQQEDKMSKVMERIKAVAEAKFIDSNSIEQVGDTYIIRHPWMVPIYFYAESNLRFNNKAAMAGLEQKIRSLGIKLVILDPFYWLEPADDTFFAKAATGGMTELKRMRSQYDVSFLLVHHARKDSKSSSGRDAIYGSQLLNAAFEGVWLISNEEGRRTLSRSGKIYEEQTKFNLNNRYNQCWSRL